MLKENDAVLSTALVDSFRKIFRLQSHRLSFFVKEKRLCSYSSKEMACSLKFLNPIKLSCTSIFRRHPVNGKFELIRTWMKQFEPKRYTLYSKLIHQDIPNVHLSGNALSFGGLLGVSFIIGSLGYYQQVAYAMDGQDILVDDRDFSGGSSNVGKDFPLIWIYLCKQSVREKPYLYLLKSLYANKVEVQDCKLFCLATVEVKDQKLTLVGVLGGWWVLPFSQRAFSVFWDSALY
ncbi:uncharacterized protein LOC8289814 isoform X4 [Ricinus communis]|uniref:uncharacterized protein LOC8289814 isoform X4 n=1 Tax=Ricinus communis TaxID=3988 RepID=UPI00077265B2|nr:uncharacterized protein LOC8289814 isoform X4 [Ricinus communis]|eukprot:XP_025014123.1 uncharacterized protein LOC8289814 isoform X4 [Ricinus communis]